MGLEEIELPPKLMPLVRKPKRFKIAVGGRAGAKSVGFANIFVERVNKGFKVGCFREFQNTIKDSVHALIKSRIDYYKAPGFKITDKNITHGLGGHFSFVGLARNLQGVKSMHGFHYFWVEEGQFLSQESIDVLTPTLREENSEIWISANLMSSADPFSQRFIEPFKTELDKNGYYEDDLHLIIKINYNDNPWFFGTPLEQERIYDKQNLSRALYDHKWLGAYNDTVEDAIIQAEWFDAAIDAHEKLGFKPKGAVILSYDPSDLGTDDKGIVIRHGNVIVDAKSINYGDIAEGTDRALAQTEEVRADLFTWDADGMGLGLKRQIESALTGKRIDVRPFHGADGPDRPGEKYKPALGRVTGKEKTNKQVFRNKRAQFYMMLRDRFYNTFLAVEKGRYIDPDKLISISSNINHMQLLRSEICRIPRKFNNSGLLQIMSKKDMKALKIQSPNVADALMMSLSQPDILMPAEPIEFEQYVEA